MNIDYMLLDLNNFYETSIECLSEDMSCTASEICKELEVKIESERLINDVEIKKVTEKIINKKSLNKTVQEQNLMRYCVILSCLKNLPNRLNKMIVPDSVLNLYPEAITRLKNFLFDIKENGYESNDDFYLKDLCFVLGKSLPGGAQNIELHAHISLAKSIRSYLMPINLVSLIKFKKYLTPGNWLRIHTESRYLDEFNEVGWDRCYLRIAEVLSLRPQCNGMVGTSWFYDPKLLLVSPNLSYLQRKPLQNGAVRIRHRTSKMDIERATLKSKTRKKMYQEGRYLPACYSIAWNKSDLIKWAEKYIAIRE